ncbi:putative oligosaccharide translocation protein [Clavispora lusitaniae]|uniref:Man(5)GlcNAc(2)-PP-dolichol translocation protein RFT1 n=2 Tax=Clavispora lusitaniae TaxID=36911 RepID=C4YBQ8_CLAL4|nr:uncharacterized protein CLUG_05636 [Clavispora lusitaniae ATCC 42720]KAF5208502.1 Oligosaccharide translocation protein rft1 [Clavispora lusitaniae]EEQ41508.1 hypothetical protein CLUG_05636 [Clavispora lusitaniae ATCC 42720]QFZ30573.1 putative oligosaccharide translocation protein [Clavispora lusitaniae]QFZ36235.1 putative oligosaccharide translocation protein [Clavispora lusitaniae]QFZ41919.1 putative oligosaccharide translocation protein [Clavispora lusitaniae]
MSGVSSLILSQALTKAFTFASNQLLVHNISPEIFGVAAYLDFFNGTVLFFSREAERMAVQRAQDPSKPRLRQKIVNFAYLPLFLGVPIATGLYMLQRHSDLYVSAISPLPYHAATAALVALSLFLELLSEPAYALNQYSLNFRSRSKIESAAVFAKCLVTLVGVVASKKAEYFDALAVLAFASGQLAYSLTNFVAYSRLGGVQAPRRIEQTTAQKSTSTVSSFLDPAICQVWKSLFVQMIFKHLLTEGDTLLTSYLFSVADQGIYSVISNYGSILARLLFQPIEEFLRVSFTRAFASETKNVAASLTLMENLLVFYFDLSLLIVLGGYTNGAFMLRLLLGRSEKWSASSVFDVFPQYVLYLPFMAFNGILEAFFSSASTQTEISRFSYFMSFSSISVLALSYVLAKHFHFGLDGLIFANMVNMTLRAGYCLNYFFHFSAKHGISVSRQGFRSRLGLPAITVATAFVIQSQFFRQSSSWRQFIASLLFCLVCLGVMLIHERKNLLPQVKRVLGRKRD